MTNEIISKGKKLPSVYLILLDEYPGKESLLNEYGFNNEQFTNALKSEGFHIVNNARSNYKYTLFSMPSMFNGSYLEFPQGQSTYHEKGYKQALLQMYNNQTFNSFEKLGYKTINLSPFAMKGSKPAYRTRFLPVDFMLITYPSLWDDLVENIPLYFARKFKNKALLTDIYIKEKKVSVSIMDSVINVSKSTCNSPYFVYAHLNLPHAPYICDRDGNINISYLNKTTTTLHEKRAAYIEYIHYTNRFVMNYIKLLKKNISSNDIVLVMSDHGTKDIALKNEEFIFNSFNAIYFDGQDDSVWYNGFSNVNQFRVVFSKITGREIPLIKDSIIKK